MGTTRALALLSILIIGIQAQLDTTLQNLVDDGYVVYYGRETCPDAGRCNANSSVLCEVEVSNKVEDKTILFLEDAVSEVTSPCYPDLYTEEYEEGIKLTYVKVNTVANVMGYRATIQRAIMNNDHILYLSNQADNRQYIFTGQATEADGTTAAVSTVKVEPVGTGTTLENLGVGDSFYVAIAGPVFFKPYSTRSLTEEFEGMYKFTFEADLDVCPQADIDRCAALNGARCDRSGVFTYTCVCTIEWTGTNCDVDVDECTAGASDCDTTTTTCVNDSPGFRCDCINVNFQNDPANPKRCIDVDECTTGTDTCEDASTTCFNLSPGFRCDCKTGYTADPADSNKCIDDNECTDGTDTCDDETTTCVNIGGSFTCNCKDGYQADPANSNKCIDIDECTVTPDICGAGSSPPGECENLIGSFKCNCNTGYEKENDEEKACIDIDECSAAVNPCGAFVCSDTEGSYTCTCTDGYVLSSDGTECNDINECVDADLNTCDVLTGPCENLGGTFKCNCVDGYETAANNINCIDINECDRGTHTCGATGTCQNIIGSFTCVCDTGYKLTSDNKQCTDIDECAVNSTICGSASSFSCENTKGSFICGCQPGYEKDENDECININECAKRSDDCDDASTDCEDLTGTFRCNCKDGYDSNDGRTCQDIDECSVTTPLHNCTSPTYVCQNRGGGFDCVCNHPLYRKNEADGCDYYCPELSATNTQCSTSEPVGYIREAYTADSYDLDKHAIWVMPTITGVNGWKYTIVEFDTEPKEDFFIFGNGNDPEDVSSYDLRLSGSLESDTSLLNAIPNPESEVATDKDSTMFSFNATTRVIIAKNQNAFVRFTSDLTTSPPDRKYKGGLIKYERDGDDCTLEATARCVNDSKCRDLAFDYECYDCEPGFGGKHCDEDMDECNPSQCVANTDCENTFGSFICTCKAGYITSNAALSTPTECKPHLVLQTPTASEINPENVTVAYLIEHWPVFSNYIAEFKIQFDGREIVTSDTSAVLTGLKPANTYTVTVTINTVGVDFSKAEVDFTGGTFTVTTLDILPDEVVVPSVSSDNGRVTLSWDKPNEVNVGIITAYRIEYQCINCANMPDNGDDGAAKTFIVNENFQTYTINGLDPYRDYVVRVAAMTSAGFGPYSTTNVRSTGTIAAANTYDAADVFLTHTKSAIRSTNFPANYSNNDDNNNDAFRRWEFENANDCNGTRLKIIFFHTDKDEDILYGGQTSKAVDIKNFDFYNDEQYKRIQLSGEIAEGDTRMWTRDAVNDISYFIFSPDQSTSRQGFEIEVEIDCNSCDSSPCLNSGVCDDGTFGYTCNCSQVDYQGDDCRYPEVEFLTFDCTPASRSMACSWTETPLWTNDETVIMSYTIIYGKEELDQTTGAQDFSTTKQITVDNLDPYTDYKFQISLQYTSQYSLPMPKSSEITKKTLQDTPGAPVNNVVVSDITATSFKVTYEESPIPNGVPKYDILAQGVADSTADVSLNDQTDLEATISGLLPYTNYHVIVSVKTAIGDSVPAAAVPIRTLSAKPYVIEPQPATDVTTSAFKICWESKPDSNPNPGPTSYTVTATDATGTDDDDEPVSVDVPSDATELCATVSLLEEGRSYTITIQGKTPDVNGDVTAAGTITTIATAPGKVASVTLQSATETEMVIVFTSPAELDKNGAITGYELTWSEGTTQLGSQSFTGAAAPDSVTIPSLSVFTTYTITVFAINSEGNGELTSVTFTTADGVPGPVTGLDAVLGDTHITLSWVAPAVVVGDYEYLIARSGVDTIVTDALTQRIDGLTPATEYTFTVQVRTKNNKKLSTIEPITRTTTDGKPDPVTDVTVAARTPTSLSLTWSDPAVTNGGITVYTITWLKQGENEDTKKTQTSPDRAYQITDLEPETTYVITVQASTSALISEPTTVNEATANGLLSVPTITAAIDGSNVVITITAGDPVESVSLADYYVTYSEDTQRCAAASAVTCASGIQISGDTTPSFTIPLTDLEAWRIYMFTVVAVSNYGRETLSQPQTINTPEAAPVLAQITPASGVTTTAAVISWERGTPLRGETTTYSYQLLRGSTVVAEEDLTGIGGDITLTGLQPGVTYQVVVKSTNGALTTDSSIQFTTVETEPSKPQDPTDTGNTTSTTHVVSWTEPDPPNGVITKYTVTINCISSSASNGCDGYPRVIETSGTDTSATVTALPPASTFNVTVTGSTAVGDGPTSDAVTFSTAAGELTPISGATPELTAVGGTTTMMIENPCVAPNKYWDTSQGRVKNIHVQVVEVGGTEYNPVNLTKYYNQAQETPLVSEYVTFDSDCNIVSSSRRKRELTNDNKNISIGVQDCSEAGNTLCNGPLKSGTTYKMRYTGENEAGNLATTEYAEFTTASGGGLSAGEIAAIVICSILFVILLILLILFLWRRKNKSGKKTISTKRSKHYDNVAFDDSAKAQKYEVDPAAEPKTEFSTNTPDEAV